MTTHGGRASGSRAAVGTPAADITSFANAFDPSIRAAAALGPKTEMPEPTQRIGQAEDERQLGADHDEVDVERAREAEQALGVVGADGMAFGERGDSRIAGRSVELGQERRLRELPGERMLATPRADDQDPHRASLRSAPPSHVSRPRRAPAMTASTPRTTFPETLSAANAMSRASIRSSVSCANVEKVV